MCALKGSGSQAAKIQIVEKLLVSTVYNPEESRYLVRTLIGNLRTGAVKLTLTSSLARAFSLSKPIGTREDRMDEARFFVTEADRSILAVEVAGDAAAEETGKGKGKGKSSSKKVSKSDLMLEVEARVSLGEKSLRKVWSRHPNYAQLIEALLEGGLDELEERVPLAIGSSHSSTCPLRRIDTVRRQAHLSNQCSERSLALSTKSSRASAALHSSPKRSWTVNEDRFTSPSSRPKESRRGKADFTSRKKEKSERRFGVGSSLVISRIRLECFLISCLRSRSVPARCIPHTR